LQRSPESTKRLSARNGNRKGTLKIAQTGEVDAVSQPRGKETEDWPLQKTSLSSEIRRGECPGGSRK